MLSETSNALSQVWLRFYGETDLTAWVGQREVKFASAVTLQ